MTFSTPPRPLAFNDLENRTRYLLGAAYRMYQGNGLAELRGLDQSLQELAERRGGLAEVDRQLLQSERDRAATDADLAGLTAWRLLCHIDQPTLDAEDLAPSRAPSKDRPSLLSYWTNDSEAVVRTHTLVGRINHLLSTPYSPRPFDVHTPMRREAFEDRLEAWCHVLGGAIRGIDAYLHQTHPTKTKDQIEQEAAQADSDRLSGVKRFVARHRENEHRFYSGLTTVLARELPGVADRAAELDQRSRTNVSSPWVDLTEDHRAVNREIMEAWGRNMTDRDLLRAHSGVREAAVERASALRQPSSVLDSYVADATAVLRSNGVEVGESIGTENAIRAVEVLDVVLKYRHDHNITTTSTFGRPIEQFATDRPAVREIVGQLNIGLQSNASDRAHEARTPALLLVR